MYEPQKGLFFPRQIFSCQSNYSAYDGRRWHLTHHERIAPSRVVYEKTHYVRLIDWEKKHQGKRSSSFYQNKIWWGLFSFPIPKFHVLLGRKGDYGSSTRFRIPYKREGTGPNWPSDLTGLDEREDRGGSSSWFVGARG